MEAANFGHFISKSLKDGESCSHVGCLAHRSHPCEGCGRIEGSREKTQEFYRRRREQRDTSEIPYHEF